MARKRFSLPERALMSAGARVEWQNVTQWHAVTVDTGEVVTTAGGWQHVTGRAVTTRGTVRAGGKVWITPGHVRNLPEVHKSFDDARSLCGYAGSRDTMADNAADVTCADCKIAM
jgi:hypothetical protein